MITDIKINEDAKERYYRAGYWTADTIRDAWNRSVQAHPLKRYVADDQGTSYTYAECDDMASRIAAWLCAVGVQPGDVVTFQLPPWAEFCPLYLGIAKVGAVMHPVACNYSEKDLSFVMNKVGARAFICPTAHHQTDYEQQALDCLDEVSTIAPERIMLIDKTHSGKKSDLITLNEVLTHYEPLAAYPPVSSDSVACILSTSGTTGKPKQALLTHNNILFSERAFLSQLERTSDDIMLMPSPLNHATGFFHGLISPMLLGGSALLMQDFNAKRAVEFINREQATWSMGATPFIYDILNALEDGGCEVPSLNLFLCGGAPLPQNLIERARRHNILLCECYGSTESCPHVYVPPASCEQWNGRFSGIALEGIEIRIVDEYRCEVPAGMQGEEASRGPHVFVGYLNDPAQTDISLDDDGWFYSGDLGTIDEEGRLRICGRKKEIVIRGGENISAREVDDAVMGWADSTEHATIGVPDDRMGERICLFAVPARNLDHDLSLENLKAYLKEKGVSKRLWPERLETISSIPRTETGKVKRHLLTEVLAERLKLEKR